MPFETGRSSVSGLLVKARAFLDHTASTPSGERRMIDPAQLRAMVRLLGPQEMTPTAERHLLSLCEGSPRYPNDTNGDGDCGRRYCPVCGEDARLG